MESPDQATLAVDRLRGIKAIAGFIGETERRTVYLCETKQIPAGKQGRLWVASRRQLWAHHDQITAGKVA